MEHKQCGYEWQDYKQGTRSDDVWTTIEHESKDKDQLDKMGLQNENIKLTLSMIGVESLDKNQRG